MQPIARFAYTRKLRGVAWYPFMFDSDQLKAAFCVDRNASLPGKFEVKPATLHAFMSFLEQNGQVSVTMPNHTIERVANQDSTWSYKISAESECVCKVTQKFGGKFKKPRQDNFAAVLDAGKVKESVHVLAYLKMTCPATV